VKFLHVNFYQHFLKREEFNCVAYDVKLSSIVTTEMSVKVIWSIYVF